jgi:catechol 2,3-dioxygenase-like lactoylglutathione lyase family enzyme
MGLWTKRLTQLSLVACAAALPLSRQSPLSAQTSPVEARINHTALVTAVRGVEIVVSDIKRSRAFFEMLGFIPVREQELSGPDEERRTGIAKARVRRLELALGSEHLTLRQFIAPGQGRPIPPDSRGNDLWFQHVAIVVRDMDRAYGWLRAHHVAHISSGPQTELLEYLSPRGGRAARSDARANDLTHWQIDLAVSKTAAVWSAANASGGHGVTQTTSGREALVRDRDGHALLATEPSLRE